MHFCKEFDIFRVLPRSSIAQSRNHATQQSRNLSRNAKITQPCNATITQPCNTTITQPFNATITQPCNASITQSLTFLGCSHGPVEAGAQDVGSTGQALGAWGLCGQFQARNGREFAHKEGQKGLGHLPAPHSGGKFASQPKGACHPGDKG
jgi:hypothetical protein